MSEDADLIVKLWKEKRLSELYCQTVTEHEDEEDELDGEVKHNDNMETIDVSEGVVKNNSEFDSSRVKKKCRTLCCSIL